MTCAALALSPLAMQAQTVAADSVMQHSKGNRLSVGGYGEVALSRNFYSDSGNRYSSASSRKNDPSHGRFDIPHAVIYLGYDFGKERKSPESPQNETPVWCHVHGRMVFSPSGR